MNNFYLYVEEGDYTLSIERVWDQKKQKYVMTMEENGELKEPSPQLTKYLLKFLETIGGEL